MKEEVEDETRRWLRYAAEDIQAAQHSAETADFAPRHACWLAQQAAEKALKAIFVFLQEDFPFTHDLDRLRNLIPEGWNVRREHSDLASLSEWAAEARYPGSGPDATRQAAQEAVQQAKDVLKTVRSDLEQRGLKTNQ